MTDKGLGNVRSRRAALAVGLALAAAVVFIAWHLLPVRPSAKVAGGPSGRIAFVRIGVANRNSDLFVADAGTGKVSPLFTGHNSAGFPVWSPGGSRVAFAMGQQGASNGLYVMNADGSDLTQLGGGPVTFVSWSPDGSQIAYRGPSRQSHRNWGR